MKPSRCFAPFLALFFLFFTSCMLDPFGLFSGDDDDDDSGSVRDIGGNPSTGAQEIYETADLSNLCVDEAQCVPSYDELPDDFVRTDGQEPLDDDDCNFDYDPNLISTFVLNRVDGSVNGLDLLLSPEDLFFIAWVSIRQKINPYFLLGVLSQESYGNCAAVSSAGGEGCFQITNYYGQAQLAESYPDRTADWHWSDRDDDYYPDGIFVDAESYFGEAPVTSQFRLTLDPTAEEIDGEEVSSIVNFNFGIIASALYYQWQQYLLYYNYDELHEAASDLFQDDDGKALWQASAYNGGAYGAANALAEGGDDFLDEMEDETQDYGPAVVDWCKEYQGGELTYNAEYTDDDIEWLIDLLSFTYSESADIDWDAVKDDVRQVFFEDGTEEITFVDDIKAVVYVISTDVPELAPEWPEEESI
ncbi:MAG: hypothetical protein HY541_06375 [Deltaproteobacteria bacterium]|nr:hypothetical protein [Deltaproteobacteria bacterium]